MSRGSSGFCGSGHDPRHGGANCCPRVRDMGNIKDLFCRGAQPEAGSAGSVMLSSFRVAVSQDNVISSFSLSVTC